MTDTPTPRRISMSGTSAWLKDFLVIWGVGVTIFSTIASIFFYFARNEIADFMADFIGLDRLATAAQIEELSHTIELLSGQLETVTGEDGFLIVRLRQSYIIEPVTAGGLVTARYVLRRTERGLGCVFISSTPLFRDIRDIPLPGETITPGQQLGLDFRRIENTYRMPPNLLPGRVELSLSLQYTCDGKTEFDEVGALAFMLLPPTE